MGEGESVFVSTTGMILNFASIPLPQNQNRWPRLGERRSPLSGALVVCSLASKNINIVRTDELRSHLEQLHTEAEQTRSKANNARLRLMRLTEAAENLRRQAAMDVQVGKENEARELLVQKRKVMEALENTKSRVELLDKLSAKLNEALSVKETQLIGNVALDLQVSREDMSRPIRIVSPKEDTAEDSKETKLLEPDGIKYGLEEELHFQRECPENVSLDYNHQQKDNGGALSMATLVENEKIQSLKGISSYEDFLESLDRQFHEIEVELATILKLSTLVMENDQLQNNLKVQQTSEILEDVHNIREKISSIMKTKTSYS